MSATSNSTSTVQLRHHRFGLEAYDEMIARGILTSDDRVELLAGEIVEMSPIGSPHAACVKRLNRLFSLTLGERAIIGVQDPIALPPDSEPEPDITVLRAREDFYAQAHPRASDVLLLIEVADSSIRLDQLVKLPIYAAAGIVEVWIVDLVSNQIEAYTRPEQGTYREKRIVRDEAMLTPVAVPELSVRVSDVLPLV
jgi:Uma2 family endonuclease